MHGIKRRLGSEQVSDVVRRYEAGESRAALAATCHIGKASVLRLLHAHGVEMRLMHVTY